MPEDSGDVHDLRQHIDAAHAAADKLVREAQERAERADAAFRERLGDVPERGWEVPDADKSPPASSSAELHTIVGLLGALRDAIPPELSQQMAEAVRELLLAVRALIDWYLDRLERLPRPGGGGSEGSGHVEEIEIT